MDDIGDTLNGIGHYIKDVDSGFIKQHQTGVVRVNCLDCLDRTNYVIQKLCQNALLAMVTNLDINFTQAFSHPAFLKHFTIANPDEHIPIFTTSILQWAEHGDAISNFYTGTGSTITKVTREGGKKGIMGKIHHRL